MPTLGSIIRDYLEDQGISAADFARSAGLSRGYLSMLVHDRNPRTGRPITPSLLTCQAAARVMGLTLDQLLLRLGDGAPLPSPEPTRDEESESLVCFPVLGSISAGYNGQAVEESTGIMEQIPLSMLRGHSPADFFVLRVSGSSMYPQFLDGDRVLVQRCDSVDSGSIAVILFSGEGATIKRVNYIYGQDWLELVPINPEYQVKRIEGLDLEQCRVLGKVVKLIRDIE